MVKRGSEKQPTSAKPKKEAKRGAAKALVVPAAGGPSPDPFAGRLNAAFQHKLC